MGVTYVSRDKALELVASKVEDVEVVLDIGPGIRPQPFVKKPYVHICVDAYRPYLERVKKDVADDPKYVFINAPWDQVIGMFPDKSVDTVIALDFIEHLEKEDGLRMLREAERVARRQIVIYTPHGFFPQSYHEPDKHDRWGMGGGYWQTHRSGWEPEDFGEQWDFVICPDYITIDEEDQPIDEPMGAIWALRNLGDRAERRYLVMEDHSTWAHFKKTLEGSLPPAAFSGLRSVWGKVLRVTNRAPSAGQEGRDSAG
ncbi:MAG: class I SAM-dependent methyltransferase [Acidobacteria bacterium]|nr:class I SAM-dependent methyltransferase [Acidobacteriota bacterium]